MGSGLGLGLGLGSGLGLGLGSRGGLDGSVSTVTLSLMPAALSGGLCSMSRTWPGEASGSGWGSG